MNCAISLHFKPIKIMMTPERLEILQLQQELFLYRERNIEIQDHILKLNEDNMRKEEDIKKLTSLVSLCDPYGEERRRFKHIEESEKKSKLENQRLVEEVKWFEKEFEYAANAADKYLTEEDKNTRLKLDERIELAVQTQVEKAKRKHERCDFNLDNLRKQYDYTHRELTLAKKLRDEKDAKISELRQTIDYLNSALTEKQDKDSFNLSFVKCERITPDSRMTDIKETVNYLNRKVAKLKNPHEVEIFRPTSRKQTTARRTKYERG